RRSVVIHGCSLLLGLTISILLEQRRKQFLWRESIEAVPGAGRGPCELLFHVGFDEGPIIPGIVQHGRTHVDEFIHSFRLRVQPAHAMAAEKMACGAMQSSDDGLSFCDHESGAWEKGTQAESTGCHSLTAGAV